MDAETITRKLEDYRKRREEFVKHANEQIIAFNGAIEALTALLAEMPEAEPEVSNAGN